MDQFENGSLRRMSRLKNHLLKNENYINNIKVTNLRSDLFFEVTYHLDVHFRIYCNSLQKKQAKLTSITAITP